MKKLQPQFQQWLQEHGHTIAPEDTFYSHIISYYEKKPLTEELAFKLALETYTLGNPVENFFVNGEYIYAPRFETTTKQYKKKTTTVTETSIAKLVPEILTMGINNELLRQIPSQKDDESNNDSYNQENMNTNYAGKNYFFNSGYFSKVTQRLARQRNEIIELFQAAPKNINLKKIILEVEEQIKNKK